ncbi:MAG: hypothetical protein HRU22_02430 [Gammaproteobacteria bacterium]|nr:hypothetical protein [Gammaproteobacteria bacterium]
MSVVWLSICWAGDGSFDALPPFIKDSMQPLLSNNIRHWDICTAPTNGLTDLQQCEIPTRLVCGDHFSPVANAICDHLNEQLPHRYKYNIAGASHFLVTSHSNDCVTALNDQAVLSRV